MLQTNECYLATAVNALNKIYIFLHMSKITPKHVFFSTVQSQSEKLYFRSVIYMHLPALNILRNVREVQQC